MASKSKKLSFAADIFEQDIEGIIRKIAMSDITPSAEQPRTRFDDETIRSLADSIKTEGLMQPIVVTKEGNKYKIIAGERRYRAAQLAGLVEIECRILRKNPKDTYRLAVIENLQRENLDPVDEARAFRKLKSEYNYQDADLAKIVGKSRNYINEILSVADLPTSWVERAKDAGIESKNLFIQFAQAVKNGSGEQFIEAFKAGSVKTVATAKQFNQERKQLQANPGKKRPVVTSEISVKVESKEDAWKIQVAFRAGAEASQEKIQQLESAIRETVRRTMAR
ncbi:MAG: ParB/RepB/Spo0J family partition protein [Turneriella sp.]